MSVNYHDQTIDRSFESLAKEIKTIKEELLRLRDAASLSINPVQEFLKYPLAEALSRPSEYLSAAFLDSARLTSLPIVEKNQEIRENNLRTRQVFEELLTRAGVPHSVRCGFSGSGRSQKAVHGGWEKSLAVHGGWEKSLAAIPLDCGWTSLLSKLQSRLSEIERRDRAREEQRRADQSKRDADYKRIEIAAVKLTLAEKYGIPPGEDVTEALLGMNKYLRLAYAGQQTRMDWSDGCDRVRMALKSFPRDLVEDEEIYRDLNSICADFEDGRSFRDCAWNYERLYTKAACESPGLVADFKRLTSLQEGVE